MPGQEIEAPVRLVWRLRLVWSFLFGLIIESSTVIFPSTTTPATLLSYFYITILRLKQLCKSCRGVAALVEVLIKDSYGIEPTIHIKLYFVSCCSNQYVMATLDLGLKELWNRVLRIILVWSLFSLIRVYVSLHFLQFLLEN